MAVRITALEFLRHALEIDKAVGKYFSSSTFMVGMFVMAVALVTEPL